MTNPFDPNNYTPDLRTLIPAGTPLQLRMNYTAGGADLPGLPPGLREGALTESKTSDALYLKTEYTVLRGPYKGRKFFGNMTFAGGKVNEHGQSIAGNISWKHYRQIIDSSLGLRTDDQTAEGTAKRREAGTGFKTLQGRVFFAKAAIEKGTGGYADKNGLGQILTLDMKAFPTEAQLDKPDVPGAQQAPPALPPPAFASAPVAQAATGPVTNAAGAFTNATIAKTVAGGGAAAGPAVPPRAADAGGGPVPDWMKAA